MAGGKDMTEAFLPIRFRPTPAHRRPRRRLLLLALVAVPPLVAPWWRVQAVQVEGCRGLPAAVTASLSDLVGSFPLAVDPQWVRRQVDVWPAVAVVDVRLELPGTLKVSATATTPAASIPAGRGWHAVAANGTLGGPLPSPHLPVLVGFSTQETELRRGLEVARRLADATGATVEAVRAVAPDDLEVWLRSGDGPAPLVVHVRLSGSAGERYWSELVAAGAEVAPWADLRWDDRLVIGGAS
jgi:hypothetical protein